MKTVYSTNTKLNNLVRAGLGLPFHNEADENISLQKKFFHLNCTFLHNSDIVQSKKLKVHQMRTRSAKKNYIRPRLDSNHNSAKGEAP